MQRDDIDWRLHGDEVLSFRHPRRLDHAYGESPEGARSFVIHYGEKEIEFDDERDFAFAETLVRQRRFRARDAAGWCPAHERAWERIRGYLEALVREDVLVVGAEPLDPVPRRCETTGSNRRYRAVPSTWSAIGSACEELCEELTGERFGIEYVESLIAVNDLARPAMDETGRQVGENNVDPHLRVETPTEWAACKYAGSRHAHACPMNVTALRKVNRDWPAVTATLLDLRTRFLAAAAPETTRLSVGQAHLFAMLALAWSGYMMVRRDHPVANGSLPSVASSLFMVADGIRMTTAHMFYAGDRVACPDDLVDPIDFVRVTDREQLFVTREGVCAGPPSKIEEFVRLVLDGGVAGGESQLDALTDDVDRYFEYACSAIRAALVGRVLVHETRRRRQLLERELAATDACHPIVARLRNAAEPDAFDPIGWSITPDRQSAFERSVSALFCAAGRLKRCDRGGEPAVIDALWQPPESGEAERLDRIFARDCASWDPLPATLRRRVTELLAEHLVLRRRAATLLGRLQSDINHVLGRTPRDVVVDDRLLHAFFRFHGRPRDLATTFETALGVVVTASKGNRDD